MNEEKNKKKKAKKAQKNKEEINDEEQTEGFPKDADFRRFLGCGS